MKELKKFELNQLAAGRIGRQNGFHQDQSQSQVGLREDFLTGAVMTFAGLLVQAAWDFLFGSKNDKKDDRKKEGNDQEARYSRYMSGPRF